MIIIYWQQVGIQYITSDFQNKKGGQMDTDLLDLCTIIQYQYVSNGSLLKE